MKILNSAIKRRKTKLKKRLIRNFLIGWICASLANYDITLTVKIKNAWLHSVTSDRSEKHKNNTKEIIIYHSLQ